MAILTDPALAWAHLSSPQRLHLFALTEGTSTAVGRFHHVMVQLEKRGLAERVLARWMPTALGLQVATPPVLFLDQDGVVSRVTTVDAPALSRIDEAAVRRLNPLVALGTRFVTSSTWRESYGPKRAASLITGWLQTKGFEGVTSDATPVHASQHRGEEIQAWLDAQPIQPRAIAIVDDWEPMGHLTHRTVYTNEKILITSHDVARLGALLAPLVSTQIHV